MYACSKREGSSDRVSCDGVVENRSVQVSKLIFVLFCGRRVGKGQQFGTQQYNSDNDLDANR